VTSFETFTANDLVQTLEEKNFLIWQRQALASTFKKGQVLFYKNHVPYGAYVIHEGSMHLFADSELDVRMSILEGRCCVGLNYFMQHRVYPCTGIAGEGLLASFVNKSRLLKMLSDNDPLIKNINHKFKIDDFAFL